MTSFYIYHNPACSKSRQALALLQTHGIEPEQRLYLKEPLSATEIRQLIKALGGSVRQLLRDTEDDYHTLGLDNPSLSDDELIAALVKSPRLLQRPIVLHGKRAVIGRPPENILTLINNGESQ